MSIAERRDAVRALVTHGVSVQRACVLVQIQRAKFYEPVGPGDQIEISVTIDSTREESAQVDFDVMLGEKEVARGTLTFVLRPIHSQRVHEQRRYVYALWTREFSPPLVLP